jgi:hypothetical protein
LAVDAVKAIHALLLVVADVADHLGAVISGNPSAPTGMLWIENTNCALVTPP